MYVDALLILAGSITGNTVTPAAVFGSGTTVVSGSFTGGNVIDLSASIPTGSVRDLGEGSDIPLVRVQITTAFAGGTSAQFNVIASDDAANTTNVTVIGSTGAIPVAQLVANARFAVEINPRIASKGQRYLGLQVINVGANTAGSIFADLGIDVQDGQKFYPVGYAVL